MDITKEEGGQIKLAPHESTTSTPQSSIEETGESTPDEGTGEEGARAEGGENEPITLADLLGLVEYNKLYTCIDCNYLPLMKDY